MDLEFIHSKIRFIKSQEIGGYSTSDEIDMALDMASLLEFKRHYPNYASDQNSRDALAPFLSSVDYTTNSGGAYTIPTNSQYLHLLSMDVVVQVNSVNTRFPVKVVNQDEAAIRLNSQLRAPTSTNVFAISTANGAFQLYPEQAHTGKIRFLRRPTPTQYYTTQAGRVFTYNSTSSIQLEWTDAYVMDVIQGALGVLGINLTDELLIKYGFSK